MTAHTLEWMLQYELPAASSGCQQSYGRIVIACQNTVTAIALAITRDVQASEDIAQEAFLKAWQQLHQLNSHASFLPWLRQITRNLARDWLRANRSRPLSGEAAEIAISMAADPSPTAAEHLMRVEEEVAAEEIISALPAESRETLLLYYREGQSSQQVAALLGLSDAAVRKRLSRARATVREEMLRRFAAFARSSAPGTAFAAIVSSAVMLAAPSTASAIAIASSAGMAGAGKLGIGSLGVNTVAGGAAGGSLGAVAHTLLPHRLDMWPIVGGLAVGMFAACFASLYLLRYAETAEEQRELRRFLRMHNLTTVVFCGSTLAVVALNLGLTVGLCVLGAGMVGLNYQYLVTLPRVMAPMLARDAARHGRNGPTWLYRSMFGRTAMVAATVFAVGAVLFALLRG